MTDGRRGRAMLVSVLALLAVAAFAPAAQGAITSVFDDRMQCKLVERTCEGTIPAFDGVPIDINVAFPPASTGDGPYPLVMVFHGYGGSKESFGTLSRWTNQGYAAFSMSDRGFGASCGKSTSPVVLLRDCQNKGHVRLMDTRYEVRDAQNFAAELADDGVVDPQRIGATGPSYGGGMSMALAALRDRKMVIDPNPEGTLVPWVSPDGKPMRIAAAAPEIPWTDLAYSLAPNGRTLDYVADAPYRAPFGIKKESFVDGLFALGQVGGNYSATDPDANLPGWFARIDAGEPYDFDGPVPGGTQDIAQELTSHHSSYYIDHSQPPAPLLISNGWTDDLFPADEAIRFYNRTRTEHPGAASYVSLFFLDYGHQRGQNKAADVAELRTEQNAFFAHFLKDAGALPDEDVTAITQTCPKATASSAPFSAPTWRELAPGEISFSGPGAKTIAPAVPSDAQVGRTFDPITGGGACATTSAADQSGTATYRLDPAPAGGFTLAGSPTVIADITSPGPHSQIAARLLDVNPAGQQTLVGRALYRVGTSTSPVRQVFQLHPNAYHFAEGHVAKLELLPADVPYSRPTNGQAPVTVANLNLQLPVKETPGSAGGLVQAPSPRAVPQGYELAFDYLPANGGPGGQPLPSAPGTTRPPPANPITASVAPCSDGVTKRGNPKANRIVGSMRGDRIRGKGGVDRLRGRGGRDCIGGGPGDDRINSRDGSRDAVRCGKGRDVVVADQRDKLVGCETRKRSSPRR